MIKFFRKIRQNLLIENKTGKYFKYAFGEIFLIVIGILIAVQIGSWKSDKDNEKKFIRSLQELDLELNHFLWRNSTIERKCNFIINTLDSINNKLMPEKKLAENFTIITEELEEFPNTISNYNQTIQSLSKLTKSYNKSQISRFLNAVINTDLITMQKKKDKLDHLVNNTLNEWSKEPWFQFRNTPHKLLEYEHKFFNRYAYRNKLDLYHATLKDYKQELSATHRNIQTLRAFVRLEISKTNKDNIIDILKRTNFPSQDLSLCNDKKPTFIPTKDGFEWTHTMIYNSSNSDIEIESNYFDNKNELKTRKWTLKKDEVELSHHGFGDILVFQFSDRECKSVKVTEAMSSLILD